MGHKYMENINPFFRCYLTIPQYQTWLFLFHRGSFPPQKENSNAYMPLSRIE